MEHQQLMRLTVVSLVTDWVADWESNSEITSATLMEGCLEDSMEQKLGGLKDKLKEIEMEQHSGIWWGLYSGGGMESDLEKKLALGSVIEMGAEKENEKGEHLGRYSATSKWKE